MKYMVADEISKTATYFTQYIMKVENVYNVKLIFLNRFKKKLKMKLL